MDSPAHCLGNLFAEGVVDSQGSCYCTQAAVVGLTLSLHCMLTAGVAPLAVAASFVVVRTGIAFAVYSSCLAVVVLLVEDVPSAGAVAVVVSEAVVVSSW